MGLKTVHILHNLNTYLWLSQTEGNFHDNKNFIVSKVE